MVTAEAEAEPIIIDQMSPSERRHRDKLERVVRQGLTVFREVGFALLEIRDSRLYRETHSNFENYVEDRWQLDVNRAYQFIGAAEVVKLLGEKTGPTNEAQARELVPVLHEDPKAVKKIWSKVISTNEPITAQLIRRVRTEVMHQGNGHAALPAVQTPTQRLMRDITDLVKSYQRWLTSKPTKREKGVIDAAIQQLNEVFSG